MNDLISRQAAIDALARAAREKFNLSDEFNHYLAGLMDGENAIRQLPSAQPELVRCKDCKYFESRSIYHHGLCDVHCNGVGEKEVTSEDQYCSWAERKEK